MACVKKAGLVFGLILGSSRSFYCSKQREPKIPFRALASGVNCAGAEAGEAVTNVLTE